MNFSKNIKVNGVALSSTVPQYSQRSWTGEELRRSVGIQYYTMKFTLTFEMKDRYEVQSFIAQYQQGKAFTFSLGRLGEYQGTEQGAITVRTLARKGSMNVTTSTNALRVGDMVQFTNHKKLYQIVEKNGDTLTIFPQLRADVNVDEPLKYNNLEIELSLDVDQSFDMPIQSVSTVQFNATEVLRNG